MGRLRASAAESRASWETFAAAVLCMASAGTVYWFPALGPGLMSGLSLTASEATLVIAIVNSGSLPGSVGGVLYKRLGARRTTVLGASFTAAAYLLLGLLVRARARSAFPLAAALAGCVVTSVYFVYGAQMAAAAAAFPPARRGQVLGFLSAVYAMSAGICGVLQSAFFPRVRDTEYLLYFVAAFVFTPVPLALFLLPRGDAPAEGGGSASEQRPLIAKAAAEVPPPLPAHEPPATPASMPGKRGFGSGAHLMAGAYAIAVLMVLDLQFGAYATWEKLAPVRLTGAFAAWAAALGLRPTVRVEVFPAVGVVLLLVCVKLLPLMFRRGAQPPPPPAEGTGGDETGDGEISGVPFWTVARDFRYSLLLATFLVIPGCSTVPTLVRMAQISASRLFAGFRGGLAPPAAGGTEAVATAVRALVVAFSACNVAGRIVAGAVADLGGRGRLARERWQLRMMQANLLLMAGATLGVAFAAGWPLVAAVGGVGFAHGAFFAITPTQASFWFGVDGFPLNFGIAGAGVLVGTVAVATHLASFVADRAMESNWVDVLTSGDEPVTQRFCAGLACYAPTFCFIAALNCALAVTYMVLHDRIVKASSRYRQL